MADHFTFIVSGGRTGTQFLGEMLSKAIDDCYSEHEPDIFRGLNHETFKKLRRFGVWNMVVGRTLGLAGVRVLGTRHLIGKDNLQTTIKRLREQRRAYHQSVPQRLLIESYYAWWMVAPHISLIFPNSNVVGVIRDPRHWIESWRSKSPRRADGHWTHHLPPGPVNPATIGDDKWRARWGSMSDIAKLAWQWSLINGTILKTVEAEIFRFEDIFDSQADTLASLCRKAATFPDRAYHFCPANQLLVEKRNASTAHSDAWTHWSKQDRALVNEICGPLMERFDYALL